MKIKNTLNTPNAAASVYFEPNETKDLSKDLVDLILIAGKDFEIVKEKAQEIKQEIQEEPTDLKCKCGFEAKTKAGLRAHQRKCL
jgi:hypothetical protein